MLRFFKRDYKLIPGTIKNNFHPTTGEYIGINTNDRKLLLLSNPCNPTEIARKDNDLKGLIEKAQTSGNGILFEESYEFFHTPPISSIQFVMKNCLKGAQQY